MQTVNQRLAALPELLGYDSPAALAKAAGIDPNTLRKAMQGPSKPSFDTLEALTTRWPKLSAVWLLSGKGEPFQEGNPAANAQPFFPAGTVGSQGQTILQKGELAQYLPKDFAKNPEAEQAAATPAPTTRQEFIAGLLKEIEGYKTTIQHDQTILAEQQHTIRQLHKSNEFMQGQIQQLQTQVNELLGKESGNQYNAPDTLTAVAEPLNPIGFKVRMMYPNGLPDIEVGVSRRIAA